MLELDIPEPFQHSLLINWMVDACYSQADGAHVLSSSALLEQRLRHHSLQGSRCSILWTIDTRKKKQQPILTSKESSTELPTDLSPQSLIIDAWSLISSWVEPIKLDKAMQQLDNMIKQKLKNLSSTCVLPIQGTNVKWFSSATRITGAYLGQ